MYFLQRWYPRCHVEHSDPTRRNLTGQFLSKTVTARCQESRQLACCLCAPMTYESMRCTRTPPTRRRLRMLKVQRVTPQINTARTVHKSKQTVCCGLSFFQEPRCGLHPITAISPAIALAAKRETSGPRNFISISTCIQCPRGPHAT